MPDQERFVSGVGESVNRFSRVRQRSGMSLSAATAVGAADFEGDGCRSRRKIGAMADSPVVPVAEAPNWAASRFGISPDRLDMRIMRGVVGCEHVGITYMTFGPERPLTVGHRHPPGGEEVYVLVSGTAEIKIEDQVFTMEAPAAVRVPSEQFRAIRATRSRPAVFVVAGYPIEDPEQTEFLAGFWPAD